MERLYLYLASRSKKGIKLVTVLNGPKTFQTPLTEVTSLGVPAVWQREIQRVITENWMLYEPWIESASDFNELRTRLRNRGYTNLPMGAGQIINLIQFGTPPKANVSSAKAKQTMLRRKN